MTLNRQHCSLFPLELLFLLSRSSLKQFPLPQSSLLSYRLVAFPQLELQAFHLFLFPQAFYLVPIPQAFLLLSHLVLLQLRRLCPRFLRQPQTRPFLQFPPPPPPQLGLEWCEALAAV